MSLLNEKTCTACHVGAPPLTDAELDKGLQQLPDWQVVTVDGVQQLTRCYKFSNFVTALGFTNAVGELAEELSHHPAILTEWGKVTVSWWTHKIKGLHENDLIMAAKTEQLFNSL
jgi:4a-hydroxytetrahydrobiopterin dehydratase